MVVLYISLVSLLCILFLMLIFYFFDANKKIARLSAEVEVLKKAENPIASLTHTEILDALSEELKSRREAFQVNINAVDVSES